MSFPMITHVILLAVLVHGDAKYANDIHGNTVVQDKSTGFHVFELHGFSVGVTSSVFMGLALLICATYLGFKLGLGRVLACCCNCNSCTEGSNPISLGTSQPHQQAQQPVQAMPRPQHSVQQFEMETDTKRPGAFMVQLVK